ncbi:MAG: carboxypeptidase regulatory-like domain-containing protein, partial [Acidimicrobiales bacterium]|nr:carboxypeptidase regulatory-like domain-containing protein [Acidimicrobiales bacterium]
GDHTCAVLDDDTLKCWGDNQYGQLGLGDTDDRGDTPGEMGDALAIVPVTASAVEGTVSTPESDPLTGVLVAVLRADDLTLAAAVGDTDSSFTVDVAPGQYFLYVIEATGAYQSGWHGSPTPVTVDAGQTTSVELVPPRARGAVTGTVTETGTGAPLAGVWAVSLATSTGGVERVVATGPGGQYAIDEVAAGSHLLAFVDPAGGHASRFHPDAPAAPGATPVVVAPGAATTADGTLPSQSVPGHGAALSGTVRESGTGAPLADVRVVALRSSDFTMARGTTTNAAGNYTLNVPLGQAFRVAFLDPAGAHASEWYDDQPGTSLATSVAVTSPATAHASLERTTGRLDGTVTRSGGAPAAGVWAVAVGADGVAGAATTGADGGYELAPLSAGTYRVAFVDPATAHTEYWLDAPDHATASVFVIDAGHTTTIDADLGP